MIGGVEESVVRDYDIIRDSVQTYATLEETDKHVVSSHFKRVGSLCCFEKYILLINQRIFCIWDIKKILGKE